MYKHIWCHNVEKLKRERQTNTQIFEECKSQHMAIKMSTDLSKDNFWD